MIADPLLKVYPIQTGEQLSFLGVPKQKDRKFLVDQAIQLGLTNPREQYKRLIAGEPVTLPDGRTVHPE